jgi:D-alanyl-D-alanine carboxypeptidase (penicillin-binding protein 5/6)
MAAPTSDERFGDAKKLLDYGFATYAVATPEVEPLAPILVTGGIYNSVEVGYEAISILLDKGSERNLQKSVELKPQIAAPVAAGQVVGTVNYTLDGVIVGSADIVCANSVERIGFWGIFTRMIGRFFMLR